MPAQTPVTYATLSGGLPSKSYILDITPSSSSPHLLLRHPSTEITIADNQSLQPIDVLKGGHSGHITAVRSEQGAVWSSGKDSNIVRWDERSRRPGTTIKGSLHHRGLDGQRLTPSICAQASTGHGLGHLRARQPGHWRNRACLVRGAHLVLVRPAAHLYLPKLTGRDTRNTKQPVYSHSSTHSDDITHLSLLPQTSTFLPPSSAHPLPQRLLLSASTDGLVALSNFTEADEEEALLSAENWGQSIADTGAYSYEGKMKVWARSDMDGVAVWDIGKGEEEEIELQNLVEHGTDVFRGRTFTPPKSGPSVVHTAQEEREGKTGQISSDYLIDVVPSLGISKKGMPMIGLGSNE